jgi:hypothetical protein
VQFAEHTLAYTATGMGSLLACHHTCHKLHISKYSSDQDSEGPFSKFYFMLFELQFVIGMWRQNKDYTLQIPDTYNQNNNTQDINLLPE